MFYYYKKNAFYNKTLFTLFHINILLYELLENFIIFTNELNHFLSFLLKIAKTREKSHACVSTTRITTKVKLTIYVTRLFTLHTHTHANFCGYVVRLEVKSRGGRARLVRTSSHTIHTVYFTHACLL